MKYSNDIFPNRVKNILLPQRNTSSEVRLHNVTFAALGKVLLSWQEEIRDRSIVTCNTWYCVTESQMCHDTDTAHWAEIWGETVDGDNCTVDQIFMTLTMHTIIGDESLPFHRGPDIQFTGTFGINWNMIWVLLLAPIVSDNSYNACAKWQWQRWTGRGNMRCFTPLHSKI